MIRKLIFVTLFFIGIVCNTAWGFEVFPISPNISHQCYPDISGDIVVWHDNRNQQGYINKLDIYGYNLLTGEEFPISTASNTQSYPKISGDNVVYHDFRNGEDNCDIYGYNIATSTEFQITSDLYNQTCPDISGNNVVWVDANDDSEYPYPVTCIKGYNIATSNYFMVKDIIRCDWSNPAIDGNIVVWNDWLDGGPDVISGKNLLTGEEFQVVVRKSSQEELNISGDIVVWHDYDNYTLDIYAKNIATGEEFRVTNNTADQWSLVIDGDILVWSDNRTGNYEIFGYNFLTNEEFQITTGTSDKRYPAISGDTIVWYEDGNIYGTIIPEPSSIILLGIGLSGIFGFIRRFKK